MHGWHVWELMYAQAGNRNCGKLWGTVGNCGALELESSGCDRGLYRLVGWSDDLYGNLGFLGMICYSRVTRIFGSLWKVL